MKRAAASKYKTPSKSYAKQLTTLNERMDALEGLVLQQSRTLQKTLANLLDAEDDGQGSTPPTQEYRDDEAEVIGSGNSKWNNSSNNLSRISHNSRDELDLDEISLQENSVRKKFNK